MSDLNITDIRTAERITTRPYPKHQKLEHIKQETTQQLRREVYEDLRLYGDEGGHPTVDRDSGIKGPAGRPDRSCRVPIQYIRTPEPIETERFKLRLRDIAAIIPLGILGYYAIVLTGVLG